MPTAMQVSGERPSPDAHNLGTVLTSAGLAGPARRDRDLPAIAIEMFANLLLLLSVLGILHGKSAQDRVSCVSDCLIASRLLDI